MVMPLPNSLSLALARHAMVVPLVRRQQSARLFKRYNYYSAAGQEPLYKISPLSLSSLDGPTPFLYQIRQQKADSILSMS